MRGYREFPASATAAGISIGLVVAAIVAGFLYASQAEPTGVSDLVLSDKADRAMQANSSVETALIGLITSISTVLLTVAGIWAKNRWDTRQVKAGLKERRSSDGNGNGHGCVLSRGPMGDHLMPPVAREFYAEMRSSSRQTLGVLEKIAETLRETSTHTRETREADAEHRRKQLAALRGLHKIQIAIAIKTGITGLEFIDQPGE